MDNLRTPNDYRQAIDKLAAAAESSLREGVGESAAESSASAKSLATKFGPNDKLAQYMRDFNLTVSEEALAALRAEVHDIVPQTDMMREAVTTIVKPLLEEWIRQNLEGIAREVVADALKQMAQTRAP